MIRQPSTEADLFHWWRDTLRGLAPARTSEPQCGFYRAQLVKGGPWVPVRIWCEQEIDPETGELVTDEILRCEAEGLRRDPWALWTWLRPITRDDYDALIARRDALPMMQGTRAKIETATLALRP